MLRGLLLAGSAAVLIAGTLVFWQAPAPTKIRDRIAPVAAVEHHEIFLTVFGSSLTKRAVWPRKLRLNRCGGSVAATEIRSIAGAGSDDGIEIVESHRGRRRDVAILEYAINDADLIDGVSRARSLDNHRRIIATLRERYPEIVIVLMATNPVIGLQRLKRPKLMAYYEDYAALAEELNVSFFDGTARWIAADPGPEALPDGLHPDPQIEAEIYAKPLRELIARALQRPCRD